ncbi:hypothetical protein P5673_000080, partial [Acropora cervicornis]
GRFGEKQVSVLEVSFHCGDQRISVCATYNTSQHWCSELHQMISGRLGDSVKNKCLSKQSFSAVEIKGSPSLPDRMILNTGSGSLIFKLDQGL